MGRGCKGEMERGRLGFVTECKWGVLGKWCGGEMIQWGDDDITEDSAERGGGGIVGR